MTHARAGHQPTRPLDNPATGWFGADDTADKVAYLCQRVLPVWLAAVGRIDPVSLIDHREWFTADVVADTTERLTGAIRRTSGPLSTLLALASIPTPGTPGQARHAHRWGPQSMLLLVLMEQLANDLSALHPTDPQDAPTLTGTSLFNPWATIAAGLHIANRELGNWWQHLPTAARPHLTDDGVNVWWSPKFESARRRVCRRFGARTELTWTLIAPPRFGSMRQALQTLHDLPLLDGREQLVLQLAARAPLADVLDTVTELTSTT